MATRVCPSCNAQYVASVRRCIDCDVMLVDEASTVATSSATVEASSGDQVAYELEGWGTQLRQSLAGMLDLAGIPFVWEAGTLVVPAAFEQDVDGCIAAVEGDDAADLPDDVPLVAFEIEGATPEELDELDAVLIAEHVPHSWEDGTGALLVPVEHEDTVAELIDRVLDGDGDEDEAEDGLALHQALDRLYVAVDKLVKDVGDEKLAMRTLEAGAAIDGLGVPYGLSGADWRAFGDLLAELQEALRALHPSLGAADGDEDEEHDAGTDGDDAGEDDGEAGGEDDGQAAAPATTAEVRARALRDRLRELI